MFTSDIVCKFQYKEAHWWEPEWSAPDRVIVDELLSFYIQVLYGFKSLIHFNSTPDYDHLDKPSHGHINDLERIM